MKRRGAVLFESGEMHRRAVALVRGETVFGKLFVQFAHALVAVDLGDDGSGGDGDGQRVAVDDGGLRAGVVEAERVDEQVIWRGREPEDGLRHGDLRCLVDVDAVDGDGIDFFDGNGDGLLLDDFGESLAVFAQELLGVAQAADAGVLRQNDGGGYDTAEERASAYFVDSSDDGEALSACGLLVFVAADEGAQHAHFSGGGG